MSAYNPQETESKLYAFWQEGGYFKADASSSKPSFAISIPPPNVTGVLHMGHALVDTLQDVLIRMKRMQGFETLWVPGTDHAGIATQTVVERDQIAKTGKRRSDFEREDFLKLVWQWKEKNEQTILSQLKRLGCSCDWDRLAFTMDETRANAVRSLFKKMFEDGLIYRGDYLVNWDPVTQTALADDEVEYEEKESNLWHMRYPLEDGSGHLVVATTRPETMLGDTAVAVNPNDERYQSLIGKQILLPLTNRKIPIIADSYVEKGFGSGAVKITPAHDPNDYEVGLRHSLPMINIMTPDGKIKEGAFAGKTMEEARLLISDKMKELGLIEKIEPYKHRVGVSYRSKAVIEPYLSKQWFVKMSPFKDDLIDAVKSGKVEIIPNEWESTYFHWIENLRDWCISRQLWWGHRIPIWYNKDNPELMLCHAGQEPPEEVLKNPEKWRQDEDVLDTWFSSGLWPFSNLGWPEETPDLKKFYPNSVLITGHDILFFWVARMIAMGQYALGEVPFPKTFIHGLIYGKSYWRLFKDGSIAYLSKEEKLKYDLGETLPPDVHTKWEKMSKSKGNVIDPIEIIDTYGTDAMRIALCSVATFARQIDLDLRRFEEHKNFMNKIWNGARFVLNHLEDLDVEQNLDRSALQLEDKWILSRLNHVIETLTTELENYRFDKAAQLIYTFFWDEFCAYYLEIVKPILFGKTGTLKEKQNKKQILCVVLCNQLRLFHPMIPFITEELFKELKAKVHGASTEPYMAETLEALKAPACIVAPFPKVINKSDCSPEIDSTFAFINQVLHAIRNIRAEMQLAPNIITDLFVTGSDKEIATFKQNLKLLKALVRLGNVELNQEAPDRFCASSLVSSLTLTIPLPKEMQDREKARLLKQREKLLLQEKSLRSQLSNENFVERAPKELVEKSKQNLNQIEEELSSIGRKLDLL